MPEPSGFGLLAIYPGIVSNPPGFSFYRTGLAGTIDQYLVSATGTPQLLFSVFTGTGVPLDLVSGTNNSFDFDQGIMHFGTNFNQSYLEPGVTGGLNVFWNGNHTSAAGFVITQRNSSTSGGAALRIREKAGVGGQGLDYSTFVGSTANLRTYDGVNVIKELPDRTILHLGAVYQDTTFNNVDEASSSSFGGHVFGNWDGEGAGPPYGQLGIYPQYTEVGAFNIVPDKSDFGGIGSFVIRTASVNPTSQHPSGTTFFTSSVDKSLNVRTASGQQLQLAPGITGVNRYAHATGIYKDLDIILYENNSGIITNDEDGKILFLYADNEFGSTYQIDFHSGLRDGFSCELITRSSIPGYFRALGANGIFGNDVALDPFSRQKIPKGFVRSFITKKGVGIYVNNVEEITKEIYIPASQFYSSFVSGATGASLYNATSASTYQCFDFHNDTTLSIETSFHIPREWTNSIRCGIVFAGVSGTAATNVLWNIKTKDQLDYLHGLYGMSLNLTAAMSLSGLVDTKYSTAFTPFNSVSEVGDLVHLKLTRSGSAAADTLAATAKFMGMYIEEY